MILLPHHHEFAETLANLPFFYKEMANESCETLHILQKSPNQLPELVNADNLQEYLLSGEADEYIEFVDGYADDGCDNEVTEKNDGLLSWGLSDEWLGSI
jgi:hypothetical protein